MKLNKLRWFLSDFLWFRLLGGSKVKKEKQERVNKVVNSFLLLVEEMEPYIIDGKFNWYREDEGIHLPITLLLPERSIVIQVYGPEVSSWQEARLYCKNKKSWESSNKAKESLRVSCKKCNLELIEIFWGDPINNLYLKSKLEGVKDASI